MRPWPCFPALCHLPPCSRFPAAALPSAISVSAGSITGVGHQERGLSAGKGFSQHHSRALQQPQGRLNPTGHLSHGMWSWGAHTRAGWGQCEGSFQGRVVPRVGGGYGDGPSGRQLGQVQHLPGAEMLEPILGCRYLHQDAGSWTAMQILILRFTCSYQDAGMHVPGCTYLY